MLRRLAASALLLAAMSPLGGCATLAGVFGLNNSDVTVGIVGTHKDVTIETQGLQSGAKGTYTGHDRVKIKLTRDQDYRLTVSAKGYETQEMVVQRKFNLLTLADGCCIVGGATYGAIGGASVAKQFPSALQSAAASAGSYTGLCCLGCTGCCLSGIGFGIDSASNSTNVFDPEVTVTLKKAQKNPQGAWVLPIEVADGHGHVMALVDAPATH